MSGQTNGEHPYQVHIAGTIAKRLYEIQHQAEEEGRGEAVLTAIRDIVDSLRRDPNTFGEPLYRLPTLRMQVRNGAIRPLVVNYGVYEERPLVFIKSVSLMSIHDSYLD